MSQQSGNNSLLFVAGVLVGVAAAALLTPKTGADMRRTLKEKAEKAKSDMRQSAQKAREKAEKATKENAGETPKKPSAAAKTDTGSSASTI